MADVTYTWDTALAPRVRQHALAALRDGAEHILEEGNRTIPHQEGVMQGSGDIDVDESAGEASVFYDTPYAVRQHDDVTLRHDGGRRAKWLEATLSERGQDVLRFIEREIQATLKG